MKKFTKYFLIGMMTIVIMVACSKGDKGPNDLTNVNNYEETVTRDNNDTQDDSVTNGENGENNESENEIDNKDKQTYEGDEESNKPEEGIVTYVEEDRFLLASKDSIEEKKSLEDTLRNISLDGDFKVKFHRIWEGVGVEWNYASFITDMYMLVGEDNTLIGTFRGYNNQWTYTCDFDVNDIIFSFDDRVIVSGINESEKKLCFDVFDYYGNHISSYTKEIPDLVSGMGTGPKDFDSFYYIYKTNDRLMAVLMDFSKDTLTYDRAFDFNENVKNIWVEKNAYIVERITNNQGIEIDICNVDFDILERKIIAMEEVAINSCQFEYGESAIRLACTITKEEQQYEALLDLHNQYQENYSLNVLDLEEDNPYDSLKEACYHIIHEDYKQYDNFTAYDQNRVLDGNYSGINYFYNHHNGSVVKEMGNGTVAQSLGYIGLDNDSKMINVKENWVGLNSLYTVKYVDKANDDKFLEKLMDRTIFGGEIFYNPSEQLLYFIDGKDHNVYSIDKQGNENKLLEVHTDIITNIIDAISDGGYWYLYGSNQFVGIGIPYNRLLFYKGIDEDDWQTVKEEEIVIQSGEDIYYKDTVSGCQMVFNYDKKGFNPEYPVKKEPFSSIILDDQVYINYYAEEGSEGVSQDPHTVDSEFLPYDFYGTKYKLLNVLNKENSIYFREYETKNVYKVIKDQVVNVLDKKVRLFDVHNQYIAYTSYNNDSGLFLVNQETGQEQLVYSEDAIASLAIKEPYVFYTTAKSKKLYRYNLQTQTIDWIANDSANDVFIMSDLVVYHNIEDGKLYLHDMNTLEYKDSFGADSYKKYKQYIVYASMGTLLKYDVTTGKDTIITYIPYPGIHEVHNNTIYFGIYIDGPAPLVTANLEDKINMEDFIDLGNSKYLCYDPGDFGTRLWFYDAAEEKFFPLGGGESVKYTVELPYIKYEYENYNDSGKYHFNVNDYTYQEIK